MKLLILKNNLLEGLYAVEKAVGENLTLSILKNVLLETQKNQLKISATNLELASIYYASSKIIEEGKVCIPFSVIYNLVKNLNSERIQLEKTDQNLIVKTDNYEGKILGQNSEDFPIIPSLKKKEVDVIFKAQNLKDYLNKAIVCVQYSEIRPEISGVFLKFEDHSLKIVSTDSFRLLEQVLDKDSYEIKNKNLELIIPLKTVQELLRVIKNDTHEISLFLDENQVLFKTENQEIISRVIDGQFPDYKTVIPKETKNEIEINRQEFINALKITSVFSSRTNDVALKVGDNKKFLEVFANEAQIGENCYLIPIKLKGEKLTILFNWHYLLDGLRIYFTEEVILGINDVNSAVVIKAKEEQNLLYILMPLKL